MWPLSYYAASQQIPTPVRIVYTHHFPQPSQARWICMLPEHSQVSKDLLKGLHVYLKNARIGTNFEPHAVFS